MNSYNKTRINSYYLKSLLAILFATLFAVNTKAQQLTEVKFDNDGHLFVIAEVGLNLGDVVTHINGKPIEGYSKEQRREFSETADIKYSLTIKRCEATFTVDITNFNDDTLWL